jgi:hypothetical protein
MSLPRSYSRIQVSAQPGSGWSAGLVWHFGPIDVKDSMVAFVPPADGEQSTRRRILAATFLVLARDDCRKLQLSELHC